MAGCSWPEPAPSGPVSSLPLPSASLALSLSWHGGRFSRGSSSQICGGAQDPGLVHREEGNGLRISGCPKTQLGLTMQASQARQS